jgi:hypothetical protein
MQRLLVVPAALLVLSACPAAKPTSRATQVQSRADLIGGPRALGEIGDYLLENDKVRFIVQGEGFSRGFGVFGGGLLDADLVRTTSGRGDSEGGQGQDNFGEMFPGFFLEALDPHEVTDPNGGDKLKAIEIENDGSDGKAAVVVVRGLGGDFLALTQSLNEALLDDPREDPKLLFEQRYILEPGAQYLTIESRVQNRSFDDMSFNVWSFGESGAIPTPFGDVVLFGAGNKVFLPHEAGFDIRYRLEKIYDEGGYQLPAIPGLVAEYIASASEHVSYGIVAAPNERNYPNSVADQFPGATTHSVHVPFIASAFTGLFQVLPPDSLKANDEQPGGDDEFTFRRYFVVGSGDVASVTKVVLQDVLKETTGLVHGRLIEQGTNRALTKGSVIFYDGDAKATHAYVREDGRFQATLRPGTYSMRAYVKGRAVTKRVDVKVAADATAYPILTVPQAAELLVTVVEPGVGPVPAKATLVGTAPAERAGDDPKTWLFDLSVGEPWRYTDFVPDDADDPDTLRFVEDFVYAKDGSARLSARPGTYTLSISRGPEYDRFEQQVELKPGVQLAVTANIARVVDTTGYLSADFHMHTRFSLDSDHDLPEAMRAYAGEGLEYAVSTDHNFVVDYSQALASEGLERFMASAVGIELTTIDRGHFNGFPIERGDGAAPDVLGDATIASRTFGSFPWALRDPADIFADLRARAQTGPDGAQLPVIVQVNHPRDTILGYFEQYAVDPETLVVHGQSGLVAPKLDAHPEFAPEKFSWDFDAMEIFNGKRYEFLHSYRVPAGVTFDPVSCCPVRPGDVFRERPGQDCDDAIAGDCDCDDAKAEALALAGECSDDEGVAFPGVIEDWFAILKTGKRVIGTGNSDSHEPHKEEPGYPRTYVGVPVDVPSTVRPADVVAAFQSGDVLMSNGPFLDVKAGDVRLGGTVEGTSFTVDVQVRAAPWVDVDRVSIFVDGERVDTKEVELSGGKANVSFDVQTARDGFLVVECEGDDSMFPTLYPNEIPPLQFTDVLGSLGDSFGFGANPDALKPSLQSVTTPYALTNPIWIDADGDGEVTPAEELPDPQASTAARRTVPAAPAYGRPPVWRTQGAYVPTEAEVRLELEREAFLQLPLRKREALARLPRWLWPTDDQRDVRRVLVQFSRHNE